MVVLAGRPIGVRVVAGGRLRPPPVFFFAPAAIRARRTRGRTIRVRRTLFPTGTTRIPLGEPLARNRLRTASAGGRRTSCPVGGGVVPIGGVGRGTLEGPAAGRLRGAWEHAAGRPWRVLVERFLSGLARVPVQDHLVLVPRAAAAPGREDGGGSVT